MIKIPMGDVRFKYTEDGRVKSKSVKLRLDDDKIFVNFGFDNILKDEVKAMEGARWHGFEIPSIKSWSVKNSQRNHFQIAYLMGLNPYAPYDAPLVDFTGRRKIYNHQRDIASHVMTRRRCIIAGEMGVGKTLALIEAMEASGYTSNHFWWVGPKAALDSVRYEFIKWKSFLHPRFMTYDEMKSVVQKWHDGDAPPKFIVFDECQKLKTLIAQRTQAGLYLANAMRDEHGEDAYIVLMSGTPAPKDPSDWYSLCEIACPGFLKEGNLMKFKNRLAKIEQYEGNGGVKFPKLITWWDDENKCAECGKLEDDPNHAAINMSEPWYHLFKKSVNEVSQLYSRMQGLVIVKAKAECLDLPEKQFRLIKCKPNPSTIRAADLLMKTAGGAAKALTLVRELSDGFQYQKVVSGQATCDGCGGSGKTKMLVDADNPDNPLDEESLTKGHRAIFDDETGLVTGYAEEPLRTMEAEVDCHKCNGKKVVDVYTQTSARVPCPKDDAVNNLLEQYEDEGRAVFWGGFTDTVERLTELVLKAGWDVLRLDGRGWWSNVPELSGKGVSALMAFDDKVKYPKLAFVGQPGAGGMGLNLTASSMECFYSNTFKGEDRSQAVDRIHRPGADHNRGCTIYDLIHLPQDLAVLKSLNRKRNLEQMTMGMLATVMNEVGVEYERII